MTNPLDTLRPEVVKALDEHVTEPHRGILRAELLRLSSVAKENAWLLAMLNDQKLLAEANAEHAKERLKRAERVEAELAEIKARIAEAEVAELPKDFDTTHPMSAGIYITGGTASALIGKRVRLVVEE